MKEGAMPVLLHASSQSAAVGQKVLLSGSAGAYFAFDQSADSSTYLFYLFIYLFNIFIHENSSK